MSMVFNALDHQAAFAEVLGLLPEQKGAYLDGLLAGAMGADPERLPDGPSRLGALRGQEGRNRYEARVQKQRDAGKASAAKRAKEGRPHFPNDVRNGVPNDVPSDVHSDVANGAQNDAPNDDRTPIEQEKRLSPLTPQGGTGRRSSWARPRSASRRRGTRSPCPLDSPLPARGRSAAAAPCAP